MTRLRAALLFVSLLVVAGAVWAGGGAPFPNCCG